MTKTTFFNFTYSMAPTTRIADAWFTVDDASGKLVDRGQARPHRLTPASTSTANTSCRASCERSRPRHRRHAVARRQEHLKPRLASCLHQFTTY